LISVTLAAIAHVMSEDGDAQFGDDTTEVTPIAPISPLVMGVISLIAALLIFRIAWSLRPPEVKNPKENPFLKKAKKKELKQFPKPEEGVKYLYRLARASEPSRSGPRGTVKEQMSVRDTVGWEAQDVAAKPQVFRVGDGGYYGVSKLDEKCVYLSTMAQVEETARLYFEGVDDLLLLKFVTAQIEKDEALELRWEEATDPRPEQGFPHVYSTERGVRAKLSWWDLAGCFQLPLGEDGKHVFPPGALSEETKASAGAVGGGSSEPKTGEATKYTATDSNVLPRSPIGCH